MALQRWGENRNTQDADATVLTNFEFDEQVTQHLLSRFKSRQPDALAFALQNRIVLLEASNGVFLDVALGALEFESHAVSRAVDWTLTDGQRLRICTAEDLVVHKAFASRDKDWLDLTWILQRQGPTLNTSQILEELHAVTLLKEDETIVPRLEALMRKLKLIP